ncbi:tRNA (adenosine(37)-N6)-threonylcarbamoyltransferase complex ATPase subunit type 1 TsaE [Erysipelothrix sp. Poltava]|nr:tRNA (adenosine(37)-N6)-threonylcarbamoyltransferase complex ATPase subunit type 1 TsaE [Erysipelothrix sp. Poltava]
MKLGEQLGQSLTKGCLISLAGDLGVGKTNFHKRSCKGIRN